MSKKELVALVLGVILVLIAPMAEAQNLGFSEFPIAVGEESAFCGGGASSNTNGLIAILGDAQSRYNITAQLISQTGISGSRISLGQATTAPIPAGLPLVAFDGTNYLVVWLKGISSTNYEVYGQFIDPSGNLVESAFQIATTNAEDEESLRTLAIAFGGATYLVTWVNNDALIGRLIDKSGNLVGTEISITDSARENAVAFDGTNYLVAWVDQIHGVTDTSISAQLISQQGTLVGGNFIVDDSSYPSDNPIAIGFDGSRYLIVFHEEEEIDVENEEWDLYARFVTTAGTVAERIAIADAPGSQEFPAIAFDGTNYLISWFDESTGSSKGKFFNTSGAPVEPEFTIFSPLENKFPLLTGVSFASDRFCAVTTRVDENFTDGDVYGVFISPLTEIDNKNPHSAPATFELMGNYPNPFNASTCIKYTLPENAQVEIAIYNIQGQLVRTLSRGEEPSGTHIVVWDGKDNIGKNVSSGVYLFRLKTPAGIQEMRKMLLLR
ncbi:MAG TPA: FlgD immunoglobulin-like domain containing protein [Candidatus Marinimicrobia bacterium]|nr:FlgD immunoglobulin-like domain containing protein [Candidatus Neomarinimicrobiota bacterium]HRS51436.1 FlgD immunoglobulin-like domain containing protein [Candidatus Neomarinimicrobiota bacterium]